MLAGGGRCGLRMAGQLCLLLCICGLGQRLCPIISHPPWINGLDRKCSPHCDGHGPKQQAEAYRPLQVQGQMWLTHCCLHFSVSDKAGHLALLENKRQINSVLFVGGT